MLEIKPVRGARPTGTLNLEPETSAKYDFVILSGAKDLVFKRFCASLPQNDTKGTFAEVSTLNFLR
jgi:hypothetical protein